MQFIRKGQNFIGSDSGIAVHPSPRDGGEIAFEVRALAAARGYGAFDGPICRMVGSRFDMGDQTLVFILDVQGDDFIRMFHQRVGFKKAKRQVFRIFPRT